MGIYVFNTRFLLQRLEEDAQDPPSAHDFGKNIIPLTPADIQLHTWLRSTIPPISSPA
jgi:glucose-1-phosphate adenylyltransferase